MTTKAPAKKTKSAVKAKPRNAFYAQSGGVTAVINVSAAAVIETCRKHKAVCG
jgi:ATP-dependent phosphofructokinase / diphosphate-dependent phosphofructokinase